MTWQAHKQSLTALGVLGVTLVLCLYLPYLTGVAARRSPFLALALLIQAAVLLGRLWHGCHGDVTVTIFRLARRAVKESLRLKEHILNIYHNDDLREVLGKRRVARVAVFTLMAQTCLIPSQSFAWLHSLLAYKFLLDIATSIKREVEKRRQGTFTPGPAPPATDTPVVAVNPTRGDTPWRAPSHNLARPIKVLITLSKGSFAAAILFYQTFYLNFWYVCTTLVYFTLTRSCMSRPLTRLLETAQLDGLEGLDQYYVVGLLGVLEVLFAGFFMLWTLIQHQQFLMLVALYTNVYTGGKDVINNAVSSMLAEWSLLAHFDRATPAEIDHLDDVCAVCLSTMRKARKTPCSHFFHGHCLRRCLKEKVSCPICNFKFKFI